MSKVLGIIPARLHSTRLPQKMLANIWKRPLIFYTWSQAKKTKLLDEIVVATDSKEIYKVVESFGGKAVMTSVHHKSGSDRVAEAAGFFKAEIVINIQGDEPIISPEAIDAAAEVLLKDKNVLMSTVATNFTNKDDVKRPNVVKVIIDKNGNAIYFSRSVIPYPRSFYGNYLKHLGIYGFRSGFLLKYVSMP